MSLQPLEIALPDSNDLAGLISQVWESFVGETVEIEEPAPFAAEGQIAGDDRAVASVSISGPWAGHLTIALSQDAASQVAASLFELDVADVDISEIVDAVGELANVVGGNVKAMLPEPSSLSLPQVVIDAHTVTLYSARRQTAATVRWREHLIDVTLWQSVSRRPAAA